MAGQPALSAAVTLLLQSRDALIMHQALYAATKLGVADLLETDGRTTVELARQLKVTEDALYRLLRALASQGVFEEIAPRTFKNSALSRFLRSDEPGSMRPLLLFWGNEFYYRSFGEILYSLETGLPARAKLSGMDTFEQLSRNPELARIFDDAMTNMSQLAAPAVAAAYDFGAWESLMDVGGGNGVFLSHILRTHTRLRGVLADLPHVLDRAQHRGFLANDLTARSSMQACDIFREVPSGCRAYMMKSVIHDWEDQRALEILVNCRRVVPADGVLLLVELDLSGGNLPSTGKLIDLVMLVMTGGKERTIEEYSELLASAGFRLNKVVPTEADYAIIEAIPT
jgi:O-methyltransferase domain/Dimerisation domain